MSDFNFVFVAGLQMLEVLSENVPSLTCQQGLLAISRYGLLETKA